MLINIHLLSNLLFMFCLRIIFPWNCLLWTKVFCINFDKLICFYGSKWNHQRVNLIKWRKLLNGVFDTLIFFSLIIISIFLPFLTPIFSLILILPIFSLFIPLLIPPLLIFPNFSFRFALIFVFHLLFKKFWTLFLQENLFNT